MIEVAVWLHQIHDVDAVFDILTRVLHSEEVPLGVAVRPVIVLEVQVVLSVRDLYHPAQITRLETRLKHERVVCGLLQFVIRRQIVVVPVDAGALSLLLQAALVVRRVLALRGAPR